MIIFALKGTHKALTDYLILIISFLIVWIQTWYLDVKLFSVVNEKARNPPPLQNQPQHESIRTYGSLNYERQRYAARFSEVGSFYSPNDSPLESENENEFENMSVYSKRRVLSLNEDNISRGFSQIDAQVLELIIHNFESRKTPLFILIQSTGNFRCNHLNLLTMCCIFTTLQRDGYSKVRRHWTIRTHLKRQCLRGNSKVSASFSNSFPICLLMIALSCECCAIKLIISTSGIRQ